MYKRVLRPLLFSLDSERVHDLALRTMSLAERTPLPRLLGALNACHDSRLEVGCFGLTFRNPLGLAAGFDKECRAPTCFSAMGFGHVEVGTVTSQSQPGNDKPRIFRIPEDEALINRMGFPSFGADSLARRLSEVRSRGFSGILGVNIGKSKSTPLESAVDDYVSTYRRIAPFADYVAVNVSSPNTPELRNLQEPDRLRSLFAALEASNARRLPLLVKVAPDLSSDQVKGVVEVCRASGIAGIIATNTTLARDGLTRDPGEQGGMSGRPLHEKSLAFVSELFRLTEGKVPIVAVGGVSDVHGALRMIRAGASLVQIYTGLVYEGPAVVRRVLRGLSAEIEKTGARDITDLRGRAI